MISDEAVEAAAKVIYELDYGPVGWEGFPSRPRKQFLNDAKKILEAAAPYMLAEFEKRRKYAALDAVQELGSDDPNENPYRSQP